jgi:hypothetical protein
MNAAASFGNLATMFRRRTGTAYAVRTAAMCGVFATLLAASFQSGRELTGIVRAAMSGTVVFGTRAPATKPSDALRVLDPVAASQTRVGYLLFSAYDTDMCRRVLFDNYTGASVDAGQIFCGQTPEPPSNQATHMGQERALALLKSFRK